LKSRDSGFGISGFKAAIVASRLNESLTRGDIAISAMHKPTIILPESRIPNPESRIPNPESRIK